MAQEAMMSIDFLNPAMSRLAVEGSPVVWKRSALGRPASTSHFGLNFAGAPTTIQVNIRWKYIFIDVVEKLGGTEPAFTCEESMDGTFQVRVSFSLPLDSKEDAWKHLVVIGTKCFTMSEAETEASVAALQELQYGRLKMCVKDVSRTRCVELEKMCYQILVKASKIYIGVKSLLSDWQDDMDKAEVCYSPARPIVMESTRSRVHRAHGDISPELGNQLAYIIKGNYLKLKKLDHDTEEANKFIEHVRDRVREHFYSPSLHQGIEYRRCLPQEIELCMRLVLQEMMISIGWEWPSYNVVSSGISLYTCETTLSPKRFYAGPVMPLTITGPEAASEVEAIESSCIIAISHLESEKSICLVDLNYSERSQGELYVVEAKEALQNASLMGSKVLTEWEAMVDEICTCKKLAMEHIEEQKMDSTTREAIAELHEACLVTLQLAKDRFSNTVA